MVSDAHGKNRDDDTYYHCLIKKQQAVAQCYGIIEYEWRREEITDTDKQHHDQHHQRLVPDPPRRDYPVKWFDGFSIDVAATEGYGSKYQRHQELVALVIVEPERLQKK